MRWAWIFADIKGTLAKFRVKVIEEFYHIQGKPSKVSAYNGMSIGRITERDESISLGYYIQFIMWTDIVLLILSFYIVSVPPFSRTLVSLSLRYRVGSPLLNLWLLDFIA